MFAPRPSQFAASLLSAPYLAAAQTARLARAAASGERDGATLLEALRTRNEGLDLLFYDVGALSPRTVGRLAEAGNAEGAVLIVPPPGRGEPSDPLDAETFLLDPGGARTLALAGIGCSAVGAAAFGRNVAAATGGPVAVVVSGYGLADLVAEALGGALWFGLAAPLRHLFQGLGTGFDRRDTGPPPGLGLDLAALSADVSTAVRLLRDPRAGFTLLVGHSRGALVLAEALLALAVADRARLRRLGAAVRVVTLSALVPLPADCADRASAIGEWDGFGRMNSRADFVPDLIVPAALHHTNTALPNHLAVTPVLARLLARA